MKELKYISIQGRYAPSFWFKCNEGQSFRSLLESILLKQTLIISTLYRTDIFYFAKDDQSDLIIKCWCSWMGIHYDQHLRSRFLKANNKQEALDYYFDTLSRLSVQQDYFNIYKQQMCEIQAQEPDHPIMKELIHFDMQLSRCYNEQQLITTPQFIRAIHQVNRVLHDLQGFNSLMRRRLSYINYN